MKKLQLILLALRVPVDFLMLLLAAWASYRLRFESFYTGVRPALTRVEFFEYFHTAVQIGVLWIGLFALTGLYVSHRISIRAELLRVVSGCSAGVVSLIALMFWQQELFSSRFIVLASFAFAILFVSIGRLIIRALESALYRRRIGISHLVIIGKSKSAEELEENFSLRPELGQVVSATFENFSPTAAERVLELKKENKADAILLADPDATKKESLAILDFAEEHHLFFSYSADLLETTTKRFTTNEYAGIPIIEYRRTRLEGWGRIAKRLLDIVGATIFLILSSPLILVSALALMIEDGRPVFFVNVRVGERGKLFHLFKLRSMWRKDSIGPQFADKEKENIEREKQLIEERSSRQGPLYKIKDDPRVTRVGRVIRRWSVDELPQFWNVLKGDMSLVGPRPHQPREVEKYEPRHRKVHSIKPGITGLAQISGRADLEFEEEVRLDLYYMENWSPWLDLYIIVKTPLAIFSKKGAE